MLNKSSIYLSLFFRSSRSSSSGLKRHNARRDTKRVPYKYQKDRRAKFKSTEDLIHRLYVCISGAADQLQSNYAADFRSILRVVFTINVTDDDVVDSPIESTLNPASKDLTDLSPEEHSESTHSEPEGAAALPPPSTPVDAPNDTRGLPKSRLPTDLPDIDLATDALHNEMNDSLVNLIPHDTSYEEEAENGGRVYAQNLDLHLQNNANAEETSVAPLDLVGEISNEFFQPEPTLLDIADGTNNGGSNPVDQHNVPHEIVGSESGFYTRNRGVPRLTPPPWVPDAAASHCMGCGEVFTFIKRRHHCRACGKVFCGRCSNHFIPLEHFGLNRPVRVCNRCELLINGTDELATSPPGSTTSNSSGGDILDAPSPTSGGSNPRSPTQWGRYYGMVS